MERAFKPEYRQIGAGPRAAPEPGGTQTSGCEEEQPPTKGNGNSAIEVRTRKPGVLESKGGVFHRAGMTTATKSGKLGSYRPLYFFSL